MQFNNGPVAFHHYCDPNGDPTKDKSLIIPCWEVANYGSLGIITREELSWDWWNSAIKFITMSKSSILELSERCLFLYVWALLLHFNSHYSDVIMSALTSQITSLRVFTKPFIQGADQRKHQSSSSLAFVRGIHRWPVTSPHKGPVTRKMFPFDDVILRFQQSECNRMFRCLQIWQPSEVMFFNLKALATQQGTNKI